MDSINNKPTKTQVFNVIILDRSGSMQRIRDAAIDGFNETLASIRNAQERFADTQQHFVSLLTFCDCEKKYVYDKAPVAETHPLTRDDYRPCCYTPLYDAMGFTLTSMREYVSKIEDRIVVVTIITDGKENSSKEYTGYAVKQLVEELRGEGWTFTYMGANQNAVEIAFTLSIRNSRNFSATNDGIKNIMAKDSSTRMNLFSRLADIKTAEFESGAPMSASDRNACYSSAADEAFDDVENHNA